MFDGYFAIGPLILVGFFGTYFSSSWGRPKSVAATSFISSRGAWRFAKGVLGSGLFVFVVV